MSSERPPLPLPATDEANILRVIAIGSLEVVNNYVVTQHRLGFAEVADWSRPLPSPNPGEIMRILTKRFSGQGNRP
ncbi:hypothetical protein [Nodosilinea sp. P-1105]|uniref:hypothetical protein n=1 Tax=Nodosilinea sp. P-1105 TaxID=2546229 RepID=UPI00146C5669|nr:hypothetical protein [Nodosilinea sp. P-1105]NMF86605.1 hypothetical protein [Nodosilinea sp. P-1105]